MKIILYNDQRVLDDYVDAQGICLPKIIHPHLSMDDRRAFMDAYLNLMGEIAAKNHGRLWWATDIASKNRFKSKLVQCCQELVELLELVKQNEELPLLVFNCSSAVAKTAKGYFKSTGKQIIDLTTKKSRFVAVVRKILALFWFALKIIVNILRVKIELGHAKGVLDKNKQYYVIKTFLYDHSFDKQGVFKDVFFGRLPEKIAQTHHVLVIALVLGRYKTAIDHIRRNRHQVILLMESFLEITDVIAAVKDILFYKNSLGKGFSFWGVGIDSLLNEEYKRQFKGIQIHQLLHYAAVRNLLKEFKVTDYLQTCENNPWEFMSLWALNEFSPGTRTLGYQHTVVPQASMNMFPSEHERDLIPLPGKILTVGSINKEVMERYGAFNPGQVEASCALRFEYLQSLPIAQRPLSIRKILLAIEGVFEAHEMVDYIFAQLANHPEYEVLIRTHPTLPWNAFENKYRYHVEKIKNFKVSDNTSLKEDLMWSDVVIYWGSTVGIEAIAMGKPAVNYMTASIVNFDPLFDCNDFKWVVSRQDSLPACLAAINSLSDAAYQTQQAKGLAYIRQYFYPVTDEAMNLFL